MSTPEPCLSPLFVDTIYTDLDITTRADFLENKPSVTFTNILSREAEFSSKYCRHLLLIPDRDPKRSPFLFPKRLAKEQKCNPIASSISPFPNRSPPVPHRSLEPDFPSHSAFLSSSRPSLLSAPQHSPSQLPALSLSPCALSSIPSP